MSFFAILLALLIEQVRPLAQGNVVHAGTRGWVRWAGRNFDTGPHGHAWLAWAVAVLAPALAAWGIYIALMQISIFLGFAWNVALLYATLGFRQFSHHYTGIRDALAVGDEERARELLALWQQADASRLPKSEVVRHVIEHSVLAAHRHVFGVLGWYSVLAAFGFGPAGAVLYRVSELVNRYWPYKGWHDNQPVSDSLRQAASRAWHALDYLPARVTALGFAVVGSFEDAIDCWRNHAQRFPNDNDGVVLAATSGAVNVQLGGAALHAAAGLGVEGGEGVAGVASTPGRPAEVAHLPIIVGLIWRAVVLWMVLLALLTLARLLG